MYLVSSNNGEEWDTTSAVVQSRRVSLLAPTAHVLYYAQS